MITLNLLPEKYRSEFNLEKARRFIIFIFVSLSFVVVIFSLLLFAEMIFLKMENKAWLDRLENEKATEKGKQILGLESDIKKTNEKISIITKAHADTLDVSAIIESLFYIARPTTHLNSLTINGETKKINIAGFAGSRDAVLSIEQTLKENKLIQTETLISPKTNILKAEDIDFSFTFGIKKNDIDSKK